MKLRRVIRFNIVLALSFLGICIYHVSDAQPTGGGPGGGPPPVPVGGIEILLLAGAAFGAKKAYDLYRRRGR